MVSASPMIAPTVMRGFSDANGSWKMICMSRPARAARRASSAVTLRPSNQTRRRSARSAAGCSGRWWSCRSRIRRPARASRRQRSRSSRRRPRARGRSRADSSPPLIGKFLTSSLTRSSGAVASRRSRRHLVEHARHLVPGATSRSGGAACGTSRSRSGSAPRSGSRRRVEQARAPRPGSPPSRALLRGRGVDARDRADQPLRVGVARVREQLAHRRLLDHLAGIHHDHALRGLRPPRPSRG